MTKTIADANEGTDAPAVFNHKLQFYFAQLAEFASTKEMERSALYAELKPRIEALMGAVVVENFADRSTFKRPAKQVLRATAWNIERGIKLDEIIRTLGEHERMRESDVLLLTELDCGMARSGNLYVAREIAERLNLNYAFAPCYLALNKGSGLEAHVAGENTHALHGNALLSPHPLHNVHSLALPNGKDKLRGKEKRLGSQKAIIADVIHPAAGEFRAVTLHLDAHSTRQHRRRQMRLVLDHLENLRPQLPTIIGGDWNTSTYHSHRALFSILGYWRRVMIGVRHVVNHHYPYPERRFERRLFRELERRGYHYKSLNETGQGTLHYDVRDMAKNANMGDWVPAWCFPFIRWALERTGGQCSLKLDWFAGRGIETDAENPPHVVGDLHDAKGEPLSDHDAIVLDFVLTKKA
jgi:endonuclease/exonuclease/phosphatase family metal-dependent hydrolase